MSLLNFGTGLANLAPTLSSSLSKPAPNSTIHGNLSLQEQNKHENMQHTTPKNSAEPTLKHFQNLLQDQPLNVFHAFR